VAAQKNRWHHDAPVADARALRVSLKRLDTVLNDAVVYDDKDPITFTGSITFAGSVTFLGAITINPGPLIVGVDPGGSEILRVGGSARVSVRVVTPALYSPAATALNLGDALTNRWQITVGGHFIAINDNANDIGQAGATRPRNLYVAGRILLGTPTDHVSAALLVGGVGASTANAEYSAGGRIDHMLWDTSAALDDRRVDLFSLNGVGGPGTFAIGITRTDAGASPQQMIQALHSATAWTEVRILTAGTGLIRMGNGTGAVIVHTDPGGAELLRVGGTMRVNGATVIQTGDLTLTTGRLIFSSAASRILMGATSLSVRDSGDTASLVSISSTGGVNISGSTAEVALNPRSGGGAAWELYVSTTAAFRLYHTGDQYLFNDTEFVPSVAGGKTLGTAGLPWGDVRSQGVLYLSAAAAKLVPGATSFSIRNNADSADNLLILNSGDATFLTRIGVGIGSDPTIGARLYGAGVGTAGTFPFGVYIGSAVTTGAAGHTGRGLMVSPTFATGGFGSITFVGLEVANVSGGANNYAVRTGQGIVEFGDTLRLTPAASKIVPGATSISHRNNADSADNVIILDAGNVTLRQPATGISLTVTQMSSGTSAGLQLTAGSNSPSVSALTIVNQSWSAGAEAGFKISGGTLTGWTTGASIFTMSQTWNAAGTVFLGGVIDVTVTAAAAGSSIFEVRRSGVTALRIASSGSVRVGTANGILGFDSATGKIVPGATNLSWRNAADSADNLLVTDAGLATFRNTVNLSAGVLQMAGTQVVTTRRTGWGAPTGTATRTTFATGTVTLPILAEHVKALIDDLTTHGLIGA